MTQTSATSAQTRAGVAWALVCSEGNIGKKSVKITDNSIITRENCREILGPHKNLHDMFGLLHATIVPSANCREEGFGFWQLRLLVVSSEAGEAVVDSSGRVLAFNGCGHLNDEQAGNLQGIVQTIKSEADTSRRKGGLVEALVCYSHFKWESYIATTRINVFLGGPCRSIRGQQNWRVNELIRILQAPARGFGSCKSVGFEDDNLRLFVGLKRGNWYWADYAGAIYKGGRCGKLSSRQMEQIENVLKPVASNNE